MALMDGPVRDRGDAALADRHAFVQAWARARGAYLVGLDDAADCYNHYLEHSGAVLNYDLGEACAADPAIRANTNALLARAVAAADAGEADAPPSLAPRYPVTENWQKAVGPYRQSWAVRTRRTDGHVVADVSLIAESDYRFAGAPTDLDAEAGSDADARFAALGMAAPFVARGVLRIEMSWPAGDPPDAGACAVAVGGAL